mmetsp:Transcript_14944/g.20617  ORF Transcript_14944/g.20617 Transcript_14944/m.20617 type:complete len:182 (+) Transcript_14944:162-707(+)|eukprot:CAMPEP_0196580042 /NCGR_PEP_ID=MMETSP1081-20130531/26560_1 /TAXON_ID=36882 /ORGANISM="Pyramimonas amylifera, Strain CCMP720" /LENGTH=181 /DNA_ID=CAMNT_0041899801 /DNA_START=141 /DNA_END=686 /DNA_ORIENTATION=-
MVKKRLMRDRVDRASEADVKESPVDVLPSIAKAPHFQRKLAKRLQFSDKLSQLQQAAIAKKPTAATKAKRRRGKVNVLSSLTDLVDSLEGVVNKHPSPSVVPALRMNPKTLKSRARTRLAADETERMASVLEHPVYKDNPLMAIAKHLEATVHATELKASIPSKKGRRRSSKKRSPKDMES